MAFLLGLGMAGSFVLYSGWRLHQGRPAEEDARFRFPVVADRVDG
jgi:hypothetical protein